MCIQTKRDTATDITILLKNAEDLLEVNNDEGPSLGDGVSGMLPGIQEETESSLGDSGDGVGQGLRQPLLSPLALHRELLECQDADKEKKTNHHSSNVNITHANITHTVKHNRFFLWIAMVMMALTGMLFIAVGINDQDQLNTMKEMQEFKQCARESLRQAEQRRDERRRRREEEISKNNVVDHNTVNLYGRVSASPLVFTS